MLITVRIHTCYSACGELCSNTALRMASSLHLFWLVLPYFATLGGDYLDSWSMGLHKAPETDIHSSIAQALKKK